MSKFSKYDKDLAPLMADPRVKLDKIGSLIRFQLANDPEVHEYSREELLTFDAVWNLSQRFGNSWLSSPFLFDVLTDVVKKKREGKT